MNKQVQLFLNLEDETRWTRILKASIPTIKFLDDNVWEGSPNVQSGIETCRSRLVYLFDGDLDSLPTLIRKSGETEGPTSGCVIQVIRPLIREENTVLSGRVAVGFDTNDVHMKTFVTKVWASLKALGHLGVVGPDGTINKNYLVGNDLQSRVRLGEITIADRATKIPFTISG